MVRALIPVRLSAWLTGDIGRRLQDTAHQATGRRYSVTRLPRGFLLVPVGDASETAVFNAAMRAARALDAHAETAYPVFFKEMGPVWTGTVQVVA